MQYYKNYIEGDLAGQRESINKKEFNFWKEEAHALWGYLNFWGDFVPGLLRPELPEIITNNCEGVV